MIVIDIHPVWWADHCLTNVLQSLLVLANAHLLQSPLNKVCSNMHLSKFIYFHFMGLLKIEVFSASLYNIIYEVV